MGYRLLKKAAYRLGYDFTLRRLPQYDKTRKEENIPRDMEVEFVEIYKKTKDFTMTSLWRLYSLYQAVRYLTEYGIEGDVVECGVWRGGSCMLMAHALLAAGDTSRRIYLYDTFAGMSRPGELDRRSRDGGEQLTRWQVSQREGYNEWCFASLEEVRENLYATGYPRESLIFVQGEVQETLPATAPQAVALLRLDTDWYESTYHELRHLYPRLVRKGVLVIDDFGSFEGARRAVEQYFGERGIGLLLHRIDATGRIALKVD